jgi:threonyl-tRNA synthetase
MSQFLSRRSLRALPYQLRSVKWFGTKKFNLPTEKDNANLIPLRHSTAHVMAMAVQSLYPEGKVAIGPWIQHGYEIS